LGRSIFQYVRRHHLALLALFVALGGTSVAATNALVPRNSVASPQVVNGSLLRADLARKTIEALKGNRGPRGLEGPKGATGTQGPAGSNSTAPGPQGPAGARGATGAEGPAGPKGATGAQGPAGADSSVPGPQGPAGADSTVPGPQGPAGPKGATGAQGPAGAQGAKGDPGAALAHSFGLTAWTFDPREWDSTYYATQANSRLVGIWLPAGAKIDYLAVPVSVAGAGLTAVELGIYDQTAMDGGGNPPVARTGDIKENFLATGWRGNSTPLGFVAPYSGRYYLASAYAGTTRPTVGNAKQTNAFLIGQLPNGVWTVVHAQAQGTLPNAPASTGVSTNVPIIIAY
jgi:hypothetical protein